MATHISSAEIARAKEWHSELIAPLVLRTEPQSASRPFGECRG